MRKTIQSFFLIAATLAVLGHSLPAQSPIEDYNASKTYSVGALVLVGDESYIAISSSTGLSPSSNANAWTNLSDSASALSVPTTSVPSITTDTVLNSLPSSAPSSGSEDNHTSFISAYKLNMNYATGSLVILEQKSYLALQPVPANVSPPNSAYWADLATAANQLGIPLEEVPSKPIQEILGALPGSPQAQASKSPVSAYDPKWNYSTGSLVLVGSDSYIATRDVPLGTSPPNSIYWTNLSVAAGNLSKPVEQVPTLSTATILGSLPSSSPPRVNFSAAVKLEGETNSSTSPGRIHLHANHISSIPQTSLLSQIESDALIDLTALPINGYVFIKWEGDYNSSSSQISFTMEMDRKVFAHFSRDLADDDKDGLSNYDEAITYGTNKDSNDSDGDGLSDKEELEIGCNPNFSDAVLFNYIKSKPEFLKLVPATEYEKAIGQPKTVESGVTPYTTDWFYHPNRGWLWTSNSSYPFFYDAKNSGWLYFESGGEKPRFYEYKTSQWIVIE